MKKPAIDPNQWFSSNCRWEGQHEREDIICKWVPVPPTFLRHPLLDPACPPLLKSLFLLPFFLFHLLLRYFRQSPPHPYATLYCPNLTNQPFLFQTNIKRAILPVQLSLSIRNQFKSFKSLYKQVTLIYGIFSGSFLKNLE